MRSALIAATVVLVSCSPGSSDPAGGGAGGESAARGGGGGASAEGGAGHAGAMGGGGDGASGGGGVGGGIADAPPTLGTAVELCKLINSVDIWDPTPNATHTRANLLGTDLGIPVGHGDDLFIFFGDSVGYKAIWPFSESVPDAVGFAAGGRAAFAADPQRLCNGLRFLRLPASASLGPTVDATIEADFAAAAMAAPSGHTLGEYIKNPAGPIGQSAFPMLPGTFEVPSGAFSSGGSIYVFYTTVGGPSALAMKASYLAKWASPSTAGSPTYQILHALDERFDDAGPLGGRFINVAAEPQGDYVYLFGTGEFRLSPIYLGRKSIAALDTPGGYEVFDPASQAWLPAPAASAAPLIADPRFGETSFRYFPDLGVWMFMAQGANRIVARFADRPEGPWSDEITVHDNTDPAFLAQYCCAPEGTCTGERLFNCSKAGFYGTYLFPDPVADATGFTVTYTMSTWDPYNVALFSARFDRP